MTAACATCGEPLGEDGLCAACLLSGALETTSQPPATEAFAPTGGADDLAFDSFGPYTILRVLGEGGMGAVYLAEQFQPIQRKVALKVIKPGLDSRAILSRFNYERQTLARMDHPNVARVYDASATAKGRPYFVMEYIEGEPITDYCDRHRLNTRQRLELFIPVCLAVQHAHSKGILHRDIKPSNVLVTEIDGGPVPKVIDFGIAKATDQQNYEHTAFTQFGQFVGTPEYMSPEAADLVGGGVDTTSDVYSLGVLLYELLVGAVPFDGQALRKAGMAELLRVLREVDAPSLPAKLTSLGQTLADIAARRASTPIGLRKEVSGELNLITLKAVEKDRTQRYDSARALSDDVQRFLDSRPVKACPPTLGYRLRKYAMKNRGAVAAAAALFLAVAGGAAATLWQARTAIRERAVAVAQRKEAETQRAEAVTQRTEALAQRSEAMTQRARAESEAARATEQEQRAAAGAQDIRSLANTMLFQLDDQLKDTGSLAARTTLLNLGLEYLRKAGGSDPNLGAAYFRVAELQESLRDTDQAAANYRQSAQLLGQKLARDPRDGESRRLLACVKLGLANLEDTYEGRQAQLKQAETALRSLLADEPRNARAMLDLSRVLVAEVTSWSSQLALFRSLDGSPGEAVSWAEKGIAAGANKPADMAVLAGAQRTMSDWIVNEAQAVEDVAWAQRAVATLEAASRQEPSNTKVLAALSAAYSTLAQHHWNRDEPEKAVAAENRAVEMARQAVAIDPENPSNRVQLARSRGELARHSSATTGTVQQFRTDSEEVTRIYRAQIARYPGVLQHRIDLASWFLDQSIVELNASNYLQALNLVEPAVAEFRHVLQHRPSDRYVRRALYLCLSLDGEAHTSRREFTQAQPLYEEALAGQRALAGRSPGLADFAMLGVLERDMAQGLSAMGQTAAALEHYKAETAVFQAHREAVQADRFLLNQWSYAQSALFNACNTLRDTACMRAALEELHATLEAKYAESPYDGAVAGALWNNLFHQRTLHARAGQSSELLAVSRRCVEIAKKLAAANPAYGQGGSQWDSSMNNLSLDLREAGLRDESLAVNREAAAAAAARLAAPPSQTGTRLTILSHAGFLIRAFETLDEPAEGLRLGLQAIPVADAIVQKDTNNQRAMDSLLTALYDTSSLAFDTGQLAQARDLTVRDAAIRTRLVRTSAEYHTLAMRHQRIGHIEERLGDTAATTRERNAALENFEKSYSIAERALADSKGQSVVELAAMRLACQGVAIALEQLDRLAEARKSAEQNMELADRLVTAANSPANRDNQLATRARLFRLMDLTGATDAEFQQRSGSSAPLTPERKQALIAEGWWTVVDQNPWDPRKGVAGAQRAVDGFRKLLRENGPAQQRVDLGKALNTLATQHELLARFAASPAEQVTHLEDARRASQESVELLETLRVAGTLPEVNRTNWWSSKILLTSMESKLAAARATATTAKR